jgi:hypothetical protein
LSRLREVGRSSVSLTTHGAQEITARQRHPTPRVGQDRLWVVGAERQNWIYRNRHLGPRVRRYLNVGLSVDFVGQAVIWQRADRRRPPPRGHGTDDHSVPLNAAEATTYKTF